MTALLAVLLAATPAAPGELPVALPPSFHRMADASLEETAALAPLAVEGDPARRLVALYRQDAPVPALFALSSVDAPLALEPTSRLTLASAVAAHLKRDLALDFELERAAAFPAPHARVEVWGVVVGGAGRRALAVAFYPGTRHHLVALASFPVGNAVQAAVATALATLAPPEERTSILERQTARSAGFWALAVLGLVGLRLWRKRRKSRAPTPQPFHVKVAAADDEPGQRG